MYENHARESNKLEPDETPSYSASDPNPSCLHIAFGFAWRGKN